MNEIQSHLYEKKDIEELLRELLDIKGNEPTKS
jgi:hypothetical protein